MAWYNKESGDIVIIQVTKTAGGLFFKFKESELEKLNNSERKQILITLDSIKEHIAPRQKDEIR